MSDRLPAVLLLLGFVALAWAGMAWGWRRRAGRQSDLAAPTPPPAAPGDVLATAEGLYVGSVMQGDWLDRVVPYQLGARAAADVTVHTDGLLLERDGSPAVWIGRGDLLSARRDTGLAGKVTETGGLVVWTWRLGEQLVESGLRPRYTAQTAPLMSALASLAQEAA
jgi:hypothetical protein